MVLQILHDFIVPQTPLGGLTLRSKTGILYGTTLKYVYRLLPPTAAGGTWVEEVLYRFQDLPTGTVTFDSAGNLYGTTYFGGADDYGIVYELSRPTSGATWTQTILHTFSSGEDGRNPNGLILGRNGVLYGSTVFGGTPGSVYGNGTVFGVLR
jgi:uncharacterized repeat protein (TIGR03803 family)